MVGFGDRAPSPKLRSGCGSPPPKRGTTPSMAMSTSRLLSPTSQNPSFFWPNSWMAIRGARQVGVSRNPSDKPSCLMHLAYPKFSFWKPVIRSLTWRILVWSYFSRIGSADLALPRVPEGV
jgi:hypothetical protein